MMIFEELYILKVFYKEFNFFYILSEIKNMNNSKFFFYPNTNSFSNQCLKKLSKMSNL